MSIGAEFEEVIQTLAGENFTKIKISQHTKKRVIFMTLFYIIINSFNILLN